MSQLSDLSSIKTDKPFFGLVMGKTGSGKTQLVVDFISKKMLNPKGPTWAKILLLSPTAKLQNTWNCINPKDIITDAKEFAVVMDGLLKYQAARKEKSESLCLPVLLILDDVMGRIKRGKMSQEFSDVFCEYTISARHYNISFMCLVQSHCDRIFSTPELKNNATWKLIGDLEDRNGRDYAVSVTYPQDASEGGRIVDACWSEPYRFILVDRTPERSKDTPPFSFVKCNPKLTPKLKIVYNK